MTMVVIGKLQSCYCFAIITRSSQESSQLLRTTGLTVGCIVNVHEPVFTGLCLGNDRSNPIFEVYRRLEIIEDVVPNLLQFPAVANPNTLTKFNMNNATLSFIQVNIVSLTCSGFLRDRRISKTTNCPCVRSLRFLLGRYPVEVFQETLLIWTRIHSRENDFKFQLLEICEIGNLASHGSQIQKKI